MPGTRSVPIPLLAACALALAACTPASEPAPAEGPFPSAAPGGGPATVSVDDVRASLTVLAADSMEGRRTGTPGSARAARFLAERLRGFGVEPAGDDGYFQRVPMVLVPRPNGSPRFRLQTAADADSVPAARRVTDVNVVGVIRGSDPALRDQAVVVGAHFDHVGIGRPVNGDSIYNGADDDASGTVAVLEIARALAGGPRPKRTVVFLLTTGEEVGFTGIRWYVRNPVVPLERTVADIQIEMIGRPDSLAGGPGRAWLTGFERSTLGAMLRGAGIPIVPDPRPAQNFFERSDNVVFAWEGVPAHTLSSFGLHTDYHQPDDEVEKVDFPHMARVIDAGIRAVRLLADGPAPQWNPGGRPQRPANLP